MKKDLKYFMREEKEEIITAPAPESFKDADGNIIELEIKVLGQKRIQEINDNYRQRSIAFDSKGAPYIGPGNEVVFKTERDNARASRHILVEALVYPDLKSKELMEYYKCTDITEMPFKVFSRSDEFSHVNRIVMAALGIIDKPSDDKVIQEAKN